MPKAIQIKGVPDAVHRVLKARAAKEGMSLSDYIKRELRKSAEALTIHEWLSQVRQDPPIKTDKTPAEIIRELRDSR